MRRSCSATGRSRASSAGACAEHSVRAYALKAIESGEAVLLRILPFGDEGAGEAGEEVAREDGAVTVQNPCLSGGAIEVFLEPILRAPRVLVEGDTPIARALHRIGAGARPRGRRREARSFEPRPGRSGARGGGARARGARRTASRPGAGAARTLASLPAASAARA